MKQLTLSLFILIVLFGLDLGTGNAQTPVSSVTYLSTELQSTLNPEIQAALAEAIAHRPVDNLPGSVVTVVSVRKEPTWGLVTLVSSLSPEHQDTQAAERNALVPGQTEAALFVQVDQTWQAALAHTAAFDTLAAYIPLTELNQTARDAFQGRLTAVGTDVGQEPSDGTLKFPWPQDEIWRLSQGWHGDFYTTNRALDFAPTLASTSRKILAVTDSSTVTGICNDGFQVQVRTTTPTGDWYYLHLDAAKGYPPQGTVLQQGDYVGKIVWAYDFADACGRGDGPHVHVTAPSRNFTMDGWTVNETNVWTKPNLTNRGVSSNFESTNGAGQDLQNVNFVAGDFNGDGKSDYYSHWRLQGWNKLYFSLGSGEFVSYDNPIATSDIDDLPENLVVGDWNGDGRDDLFFHWRGLGRNRLYVSNGNGTFTRYLDPITVTDIDNLPDNLVVGDWNGDGRDDLLFHWRGIGRNRMYVSNGNGTFNRYLDPITTTDIDDLPDNLVVGDWNRDGRDDLFFHWRSLGRNRMYVSNGNGTFTRYLDPIASSDIDDMPENLVTGDWNGDGRDDLFFHWRGLGRNRLYVSNGNGTFTRYLDPITVTDIDNLPDNLIVNDHNGDGRDDLLFHWRGLGRNRLYVSNGNGTFTRYLDPITTTDIDDLPDVVRVGDVDGNGKEDLFFYWLETGRNRLYTSRGTGSFTRFLNPFGTASAASLYPGIGGTLSYINALDNLTQVTVAPTALTLPTNLGYLPQSDMQHTPVGDADVANHRFLLQAYQGGTVSTGYPFQSNLGLTIAYSDEEIGGIQEATLRLLAWDEGLQTWIDVAESCGTTYTRNLVNNQIAVPICMLSEFKLVGNTHHVFLPMIRR